jgi:uncharacterized membrane protein YkvA (DUF1232 family)
MQSPDVNLANSAELAELRLPALSADALKSKPFSFASWKLQAERLQREAQVFYFAFKHPGAPWYARALAICTAGYLLSPIQLIPNLIPVIGFLDDVLVVCLGVKLLLKIIPPNVLIECRELAIVAETRRKENTRSPAAVVALVIIVTLWFLAAGGGTALMVRYIPH